MSESQAFSLLSVLCDRLLPGYYSTTMYGTLLDQRVFESLVERTMPVLWNHLAKTDVQLSVVSLPWFLSLYINSMPLVFAFRVLDVFFLEGPKVLFQVGLAILRINGEELLDVMDDGALISVLKTYFSRLDESAHPKSDNEKLRAVTKFQELMVVAFREFSAITQSSISELRAKHKDAVLDNIESFAKRTSIRNLGPDSKRLSLEDLGFLYDRFYSILYEQERDMQVLRQDSNRRAKAGRNRATEIVTGVAENNSVEIGRVGIGPSPELMNYDGFREFLGGITKWATADTPRSPLRDVSFDRESTASNGNTPRKQSFPPTPGLGRSTPADHDFMQRLYGKWNKDDNDGLSLQNVVSGLSAIVGTRDLMTNISYFFNLYDDDQDGKVDREGILRISEALLFLTRRGLEGDTSMIELLPNSLDGSGLLGVNGLEPLSESNLNERFLSSVSAFIRRCFEYADPDHPQNQDRTVSNRDGTFSVGEDEDDGLLVDLSDDSPRELKTGSTTSSFQASTNLAQTQQTSKQSANLALDPANPLHITLPTFRMVVLADELLQHFFEVSFPESFHLSPKTLVQSANSLSLQTPTLTTFSNLSRHASIINNPNRALAPAKGLRGVLDNIVSDGMRVAAEVRKRMDEAQRELERNALGQKEDYEDEDDDNKATYIGDSDRRSVKERDRDLLEGAEVGSLQEAQEGLLGSRPHSGSLDNDTGAGEKAMEATI